MIEKKEYLMRRTVAVMGLTATLATSLAGPSSAETGGAPQPVPMTTAKAYDGRSLVVGAVALSPGRVTWSDNSVKTGAVWTRVLTKTATGFVAGPPHQLGTGVPTVISSSGLRTAWIAGGNAVVRSGYQTSVLKGSFVRLQLSGTRLLASGPNQATLWDLRTGATTDIATFGAVVRTPSGIQATPEALWGDQLSYAKSDGSVWLRNLASGAATRLAGPMEPWYVSVFAAGNHVGWNRVSPWVESGTPVEAAVVDVASRETTWSATGTMNEPHEVIRDLGVDGWMTNMSSPPQLTLHPWDSSALVVEPLNQAPWGLESYADGPYLAANHWPQKWSPAVVVSLLPHPIAVRPQSLGKAVASSSLKRGATWQLIDVASAVVHTCAVDIRNNAGSVVRTLGCQAAWQQGEIRAVWDGRSKDGAYVPVGRYSWTIRAGNSTGSLLNSDGSTRPITGSIAVS